MNILKQLTPAETQLILNPDSKIGELLKLTFMDLLMQQILKMEVTEEIIKYHRVSKGENFQTYTHKMPGALFTHIFLQDSELILSPYELKRLIRAQFKNKKDFKWDFFIDPHLNEYFKTFPVGLFKRFAKIKLNDAGKKLQTSLIEYFKHLEKQFSSGLSQEEMATLYSQIGTNVLLIAGFASSKLSSLFQGGKEEKRACDPSLHVENTVYYSDVDNTSESSDIPDSMSFDHNIINDILKGIENTSESISDTFSSNFDSTDSSFGGGDSGGDSGCSGCGGCGGD